MQNQNHLSINAININPFISSQPGIFGFCLSAERWTEVILLWPMTHYSTPPILLVIISVSQWISLVRPAPATRNAGVSALSAHRRSLHHLGTRGNTENRIETSVTPLCCSCSSASSLCRPLITSYWLWILKVEPLLFLLRRSIACKSCRGWMEAESLHVCATATVGHNKGVTTSIHLSCMKAEICKHTAHIWILAKEAIKKNNNLDL